MKNNQCFSRTLRALERSSSLVRVTKPEEDRRQQLCRRAFTSSASCSSTVTSSSVLLKTLIHTLVHQEESTQSVSSLKFHHHERVSDHGDRGGPSHLPAHQAVPPPAEPAGPLQPAAPGEPEPPLGRRPSALWPGRPGLHLRPGRRQGVAQAAGPARLPHAPQPGPAVHRPEPVPERTAVGEQLQPGLPGAGRAPRQGPDPLRGVRDAGDPGAGRGQGLLRGGAGGAGDVSLQGHVLVSADGGARGGHGGDAHRLLLGRSTPGARPPGVRRDPPVPLKTSDLHPVLSIRAVSLRNADTKTLKTIPIPVECFV